MKDTLYNFLPGGLTFAAEVPNTIGTSIAGRSAAPENGERRVPHCDPMLLSPMLEPFEFGEGQVMLRPNVFSQSVTASSANIGNLLLPCIPSFLLLRMMLLVCVCHTIFKLDVCAHVERLSSDKNFEEK